MKNEIISSNKDLYLSPYIEGGKFWDGIHWITLLDLKFKINNELHTIKRGFITDMGSIPRLFRVNIDRMGKSSLAFLAHDYLYGLGTYKRIDVERALYDYCRQMKESYWASKKIYWGVRIGGGFLYGKTPNKHAEIDKKQTAKLCKTPN